MLKVAVLVSGGGTNLQAILDAKAAGALPHAKIALGLASKPGVYALERASKAGVPGIVVARKSYAAPEEYDAALLAALLFVVFGGVIYYAVMVIILWLKLDPNDLKLFTAIIVAIFLAVPHLQAQAKSSFAHLKKQGKGRG